MKRFWKFLPALRKKGKALFTVEIGPMPNCKNLIVLILPSNITELQMEENRYQVDSLYNDFLSEYNKCLLS
jgi:hypothetical protein